jgi:hypothetical protein
MDDEFLKEFRLEPEIIHRDLEFSMGLAKTYQKQKDELKDKMIALSVAATFFRRAAADALLLGSYADALALFLDSARIYQSVGLPYSVVVAALSSERSNFAEDLTRSWIGAYADHKIADMVVPQLAYVVLAQLTSNKSRQMSFDKLINIRKGLDPYRLRPLGVLGIPVGTLLDLFDSLVPDKGQRGIDLAEAISPFFGAYNTAIRQAKQNHYHWERLALPFHPAEPDIYGILTMADSTLRMHWDTTLKQFIEQAAIAGETKYLLSTILRGITSHQQDRDRLM